MVLHLRCNFPFNPTVYTRRKTDQICVLRTCASLLPVQVLALSLDNGLWTARHLNQFWAWTNFCGNISKTCPGAKWATKKEGPWLFRLYIGYYTTQLCEDNTKPLEGSLLNDPYIIESKRFLFHGSDNLTLKGKTTNCWCFQPLAERIWETKKTSINATTLWYFGRDLGRQIFFCCTFRS